MRFADLSVGNTTTWQYDPLDRVERETNELGHARVFTYDAVGNLTKRVDRNGRVIEYAYDDLDRLTTEAWFADEQDVTADREIEFAYDLQGRLASSSDPDHQYSYRYGRRDLDGATTSEVGYLTGLAPNFIFNHTYDAVGNRTETQAYLNGDDADFLNTYEYDNLNRLTSVAQQDADHLGGTWFAVSEKRVDLTYDLAGQFDTITRYSDAAGTQAVAVSQYTFDKAGRLDELAHYTGDDPQTGTLLAGYGYTWNQRDQLTAIDFLPSAYNDEDVTYDYDDRHQLEGADYAGLTDESYAYDENGNRTGGSISIGDNNQLLSDGTYDYEYDNEGNRIKRTNISTGDYTVYEWDHRNRLVSVVEMDANGTPTNFGDDFSTQEVDYAYDAENQLVKRVVDTDGSTGSDPIEQTVWLWQNGQIVLQFDKTGSGDVAIGDLSHRYLWGPVVDQLFADEQIDWSDSDADGPVYWGLTDHLGTPRDWVNSSGTVVDHAKYDSFGKRLNAAAVDFLFGYTGHLWDEPTGHWVADQRRYDPSTATWLSPDPIREGTNWTAYVGNSPTMFVDPDGLERYRPGFGRYDHDEIPGYNDQGQPGTWVHKYDKGAWYNFWATRTYVGSAFVPHHFGHAPELTNKLLSQLNFVNQCSSMAASTLDTVDAGITIAAIGIPGPEDVIIAGGARLGYEVIKRGGKWVIQQGGKILRGADEAAAANKIADLLKIERHHNLPQAKKFRKYFDNAGLCIDDYVEDLTKLQHRLKPGGLHTGENNWNKLWREFFEQYPNAKDHQILEELDRIRGIHGLPPWGAK